MNNNNRDVFAFIGRELIDIIIANFLERWVESLRLHQTRSPCERSKAPSW
jgi:hypothetical protein